MARLGASYFENGPVTPCGFVFLRSTSSPAVCVAPMASLGARTLGRVLGASAARAPVRPMLHRAFSVPHMADKVVSVTFSNNAGAEGWGFDGWSVGGGMGEGPAKPTPAGMGRARR